MPVASLKYLSYSQRACSTFFRDRGFSRKAGNSKPRAAKPELGPVGLQMSLNILVYRSSPLVVSRGNILLRPFFAPGPRQVHWLSVFLPRTLVSRRSQRICHAKKAPTLGMVRSVLCAILRDFISAALITWDAKLAHSFLTKWSVFNNLK